jgi:hypothetical protein
LNCSVPYINLNATTCVTECPDGYIENLGKCETVPTEEKKQTVRNKLVPFPFTIFYLLAVGLSMGMKWLSPETLLSSVVMSFGSLA